MADPPRTIEEYIGSFPDDVQLILREIRDVVHAVLPDAGETISYQIPTFTLAGRNVVHVAAWKHHVAVYPVPEADEALAKELAPYRASKGTLRFPLGQPVPYPLIGRVVALLLEQRHTPGGGP